MLKKPLKALILIFTLNYCNENPKEPKNNQEINIKVPKHLPFALTTKTRINTGSEYKSLSINFNQPFEIGASYIFFRDDLRKIFFNNVENGHYCFNFDNNRVFSFRNIPYGILDMIYRYNFGINGRKVSSIIDIIEGKGFLLYLRFCNYNNNYLYKLPKKSSYLWVGNNKISMIENYGDKNIKNNMWVNNIRYNDKITYYANNLPPLALFKPSGKFFFKKNPIINKLDLKNFKWFVDCEQILKNKIYLNRFNFNIQKFVIYFNDKIQKLCFLYDFKYKRYIPILFHGKRLSNPFDCVSYPKRDLLDCAFPYFKKELILTCYYRRNSILLPKSNFKHLYTIYDIDILYDFKIIKNIR